MSQRKSPLSVLKNASSDKYANLKTLITMTSFAVAQDAINH
jgi:hypothetical protein